MSTSTGRDVNGRFVAGNSGGPGRGRKSREEAYVSMFTQSLPPAMFGQIVRQMTIKAIQGNVQAARLLIEHAIGRPALKIEWSDESEFRVAGMTPDGVDAEMLEYIEKQIAERREYEKAVAKWQEGEPMPKSEVKPGEASQ